MAGQRHGLTFEDCRVAIVAVVNAGLNACRFVGIEWMLKTEATKQCVMSIQRTAASTARRFSDQELIFGARELVRLAVERIGYYAETALTLIGQTVGSKGAKLKDRRRMAADILGMNKDYFRATYQPRIIDQIAESLCELLTRPHQLADAIATQ